MPRVLLSRSRARSDRDPFDLGCLSRTGTEAVGVSGLGPSHLLPTAILVRAGRRVRSSPMSFEAGATAVDEANAARLARLLALSAAMFPAAERHHHVGDRGSCSDVGMDGEFPVLGDRRRRCRLLRLRSTAAARFCRTRDLPVTRDGQRAAAATVDEDALTHTAHRADARTHAPQ